MTKLKRLFVLKERELNEVQNELDAAEWDFLRNNQKLL